MGRRWARAGRPLAAGAESEGERGGRPRAVGPEPCGCPPAATAGTAGRSSQQRLWDQGVSQGACRGRGGTGAPEGAGPEPDRNEIIKSRIPLGIKHLLGRFFSHNKLAFSELWVPDV